MQAIYGYDVAADLQPQCRYDEVVSALGGAGELVTRPDGIAPALRRAFESGVPYLVNVDHRPGGRLPPLHHRRLTPHPVHPVPPSPSRPVPAPPRASP